MEKKKHNHPVTGKNLTLVGEFVFDFLFFVKNARWNNPYFGSPAILWD